MVFGQRLSRAIQGGQGSFRANGSGLQWPGISLAVELERLPGQSRVVRKVPKRQVKVAFCGVWGCLFFGHFEFAAEGWRSGCGLLSF